MNQFEGHQSSYVKDNTSSYTNLLWKKCSLEWASQVLLVVKNLPANAGYIGVVGKIPWRRAQQSTPGFLPGESHGEEPGRLQSIGTHRVGHDGSDLAGTLVPWNFLWKRLPYMQCSGIYSNI